METESTNIPHGFVARQCGCIYYHNDQGLGYLLVSCDQSSVIAVNSVPQRMPTDQPYEIMHPLGVARIFEMFAEMSMLAGVGEDTLALLSNAQRTQKRIREQKR